MGEKLFAKLVKLFSNMSRIGRQTINIPEGVTVKTEPGKVIVGGPKGELSLNLPEFIKVVQEKEKLLVSRRREDKKTKSNHGTIRSLLNNMVTGVTKGWQKELQVVGTGFRTELQGDSLNLKLGFSHPVVFKAPEGIKFEVQENKIKILGIDKELVGNTTAAIRKIKKPDVYKGKGIRYVDEVVKLKPGKAAKIGSAGGE